jgi:hypothetical protein
MGGARLIDKLDDINDRNACVARDIQVIVSFLIDIQ